MMMEKTNEIMKGERISKLMARAGLCSRREAERWIGERRVRVNGCLLETPAVTVTKADHILVDGKPLPVLEAPRVWRYFKPAGLLTTNNDPDGRPTVFEKLPNSLPRVVSIGRLDLNSEGLLLLTNDGGLARRLELPATGWIRRYRIRVHGRPIVSALENLAKGITVDGIHYAPIQAALDSQKGANAWLTVALTEGKNREVRRVMEGLGLTVNRLIRTTYGPFSLGGMGRGQTAEIKGKVLKEQLGDWLDQQPGKKVGRA